jgi:hypothetical protein
LTVFVVALMLGGVWIGYASDDDASLSVAVVLSVVFTAVGIAIAPRAIRTGLRLRREWFGPDSTESAGEFGEDR